MKVYASQQRLITLGGASPKLLPHILFLVHTNVTSGFRSGLSRDLPLGVSAEGPLDAIAGLVGEDAFDAEMWRTKRGDKNVRQIW